MQTNLRHIQTNRHAAIGRRLGCRGMTGGPTLVVVAGMHGNEPSGVFAFLDLLDELDRAGIELQGRVIGLAGNLAALQQGVRFVDRDLNRVWLPETEPGLSGRKPEVENPSLSRDRAENGSTANRPVTGPVTWICDPLVWETREREDLYREIRQILAEGSGPYYFVDLHTTSSQSPPFMPLDDTLRNRDFVGQFPVPAVLGLEEVLPGTLLSYLNEYDVVTFGYEAGQHDDPQSIVLHREMLWCALQFAGCLPPSCRTRVQQAAEVLRQHSGERLGLYEVTYRHGLTAADEFCMRPGFASFEPVRAGEVIAQQNSEELPCPHAGLIFMPLYQSKGNDGFFLIRRIPGPWLTLSRWLRRWRGERWLGWLPGVEVSRDDARRLWVNPRVARFLSRQIFHLLGYRRSGVVEGRVLYVRRDR